MFSLDHKSPCILADSLCFNGIDWIFFFPNPNLLFFPLSPSLVATSNTSSKRGGERKEKKENIRVWEKNDANYFIEIQ